jgi:ectoine hydroxylase-related dioxygenase (phytanoyl-CoA dioxygenase family)
VFCDEARARLDVAIRVCRGWHIAGRTRQRGGPGRIGRVDVRSELDREGYIVVRDALDERWVERLRRAFDGATEQERGTQHVELTAETRELASWHALREHPVVLEAARHVLGDAFAVTQLHGRNPLPGYGQQGLHSDAMPRASVEPFEILTALWMIDDFTVENGATRVVPGTHRITSAIPKSYAQPMAKHPNERIITGTAGSVLVMNGHTWHAGRKNESQGPRRAAQMVIRRR